MPGPAWDAPDRAAGGGGYRPGLVWSGMDGARPRLRLGWWWLPIIALGLLAIAALVLALWLRSTGDLVAEEERARSLGVAVDWRSLTVPLASVEQQRRIRALLRTVKRAKTIPSTDDGSWMREAFVESPAGFADWDSGVDPEVDACLRAFPESPPTVLGGDDDALRLLSLAGEYAEACYATRDLLILRSVRGRDRAAELSELFVRLARLPTGVSLWPDHQPVSTAEAWTMHAVRHRAELDASATATTASQLADHLDAVMRQQIAVRPLFLSLALRVDPFTLFCATNITLPSLMANRTSMRILPRLGRGSVLARSIDSCVWVSAHGLPDTVAAACLAAPTRPAPGWWELPGETMALTLDCSSCIHCSSEMVPALQSALRRHLRCTTGLRLLAAELSGTPWPTDPGDPAGGPLRPVLRDGVVIGAYGLGNDGLDGAGDRYKDWCWPLRARLGSPKASDPVKKP